MAAERPVPDAAETPRFPPSPNPLGTSIWVDDRRGAARRDLKRRFASDDVLDDVLRWLEFESGRAALFDVTTFPRRAIDARAAGARTLHALGLWLRRGSSSRTLSRPAPRRCRAAPQSR